MLKQPNEIRMIWLMSLIILAVAMWYAQLPFLTYLCVIAFSISVVQYFSQVEEPVNSLLIHSNQQPQYTSKVPLYSSSIVILIGGIFEWKWLITLGVTVWIFYFLRWLRRVENQLNRLQYRFDQIENSDPLKKINQVIETSPIQPQEEQSSLKTAEIGLIEQLKTWLFSGNPVLKGAIIILLIGIVLLLRFATENWQLSLNLKLGIVALVAMVTVLIGWRSEPRNSGFGLALEGLGLAGLFLTLFFAYYNGVISNLASAALIFALIMALTLFFSLKQELIELSIMAIVVAYFAPFTLPMRSLTAIELVSYYLLINSAILILNTLRPWKILNQIAFIITVVVGVGYALVHSGLSERTALCYLVFAHSLIFIWLSFRFSQLLAKQDLSQFKIKPALDIALIFSAPLIGFLLIYLMYFEEATTQIVACVIYSILYFLLYFLSKRNQFVRFISKSYLSLALIFLVIIPPILLNEEWSVLGWSIEGAIIFIIALYNNSNISKNLALGLLMIGGLFGAYYVLSLPNLPVTMLWVLSVSYLLVMMFANLKTDHQNQINLYHTIILSLLSFSTVLFLMVLCFDALQKEKEIFSLIILTGLYVILNELIRTGQKAWSWILPKWLGIMPLMLLSAYGVITHIDDGAIQWSSMWSRISYLFANLGLALLWLRPKFGLIVEREWVSLGAMISLAFASLTLYPQNPFISIVILPLIFCIWCAGALQKNNQKEEWQIFWQTRSSLMLMMLWIICSQVFSQQTFQIYILPIFNLFDLVSLAMLVGFLWMLKQQLQAGLDRGIVAILMVLSLLWLSSYILLRALHVYLGTPYNDLAIWQDASVQLSLTLLWVSLAFITMSLSSKKQIRAVWILGASILSIVIFKLVILDLSHIGTLSRVISFLAAGLVMLIIAYIAPIPEVQGSSSKVES